MSVFDRDDLSVILRNKTEILYVQDAPEHIKNNIFLAIDFVKNEITNIANVNFLFLSDSFFVFEILKNQSAFEKNYILHYIPETIKSDENFVISFYQQLENEGLVTDMDFSSNFNRIAESKESLYKLENFIKKYPELMSDFIVPFNAFKREDELREKMFVNKDKISNKPRGKV